jgi:hypothetical protein
VATSEAEGAERDARNRRLRFSDSMVASVTRNCVAMVGVKDWVDR